MAKKKTTNKKSQTKAKVFSMSGNDNIKSNDFNSEKELSDYLEQNINIFTYQYLNDICVSFNFGYAVTSDRYYYKRKIVDLVIEGKKKIYVIELKNPKYSYHNISAIGQLLDYGRHFQNIGHDLDTQLVLLSSMYDVDTALTIQKYNLPIRYFYLEKEFGFEVPKYGG